MPAYPSPHAAFGACVREAREKQRLSQDDLARRTGMHPNYVGGIERGERNPSLGSVVRLAVALDVSVADLVRGIEADPERGVPGPPRRG
jgi:transcriptional regulator with XRE-family HTH domain